ncbi:hypothetical protein [Stenotrophomonas phage RAS14]
MKLEQLDQWYVECKHHVSGTVREVVEYCIANQITSAKVIDVGSNVGGFVEGLSNHITIEDAIQIEPIEMLREYAKNLHPEYTYIGNPVSNKVQTVHIYTNPDSLNLGTSKIMPNPPETDVQAYETTTLTILSKQFDFKADIVKVDAEGHDIECIDGYLEYLQETGHRPALITIERTRDMDFSALLSALELLGYRMTYLGHLDASSELFFIPKDANKSYHMIEYEKGA